MLDADILLGAGKSAVSILSFRAAPVVAWAGLAPGVTFRGRAVAFLVAVALTALVVAWSAWPLGLMAVAYGYFAAAGCGARALAVPLRRGRVTQAAVFSMSVLAFVVAPGIATPPEARTLVVIVGWELMFSAYSYCVEMAKSERPTPISDCLFFLLVNPALVYPNRGKRQGPVAIDLRGLGRLSLGLCVLFAVAAVVSPAAAREGSFAFYPGGSALAGVGALRPLGLFRQYLEHSSVASLQIGLMLQLGYAVPERYVRPFAASGPLDFWRRWNTYVGGWMQRYVFWPASLRMARSGGSVKRRAAQAACVILTFVCVGGLHELSGYLMAPGLLGRSVPMFLACGLLVLGWTAASSLWSSTAKKDTDPFWLRAGLGLISRVLFWWSAVVLFSAWTQ